ncbi:MAG: hypothetical protein NTY41_15525 [Proteobacteria bacterium]|nr:hypothetical protein [Pseudomonadota bacterium]
MWYFEAAAFSGYALEAVYAEDDVLASDEMQTHPLRKELAAPFQNQAVATVDYRRHSLEPVLQLMDQATPADQEISRHQ